MKKTKYYSFRSYLTFMGRYKGRFAIVLFTFMIANALLAVIPVFIGRLVGALAAQPADRHQAIIYVIILIVCSSGHNLFWRLSEYLYLKLILPISFLYENVIFQQVIGQPYPYFVDKFTGKVSSYVSTLSEEMRAFIENLCFNYMSSAVNLIAVMIILTSINWQTGLIFLIGIICMFFVGRHTMRNNAKYEKVSEDVKSTKKGKIIDAIGNFVNVKSFQKESQEIRSVEHEQTKTIAASGRSFFWGMVFWGSMSVFVRDLIWPITIILNVYLFLHGQLSIAQLTTLLSTILLFTNFVWEIIWYVSQLNLRFARAEEAHNYLFGKQNIAFLPEVGANSGAAPDFNKSLEFSKLTFAYPDKTQTNVLNEITLQISKGEKIGIVGRSGSGKSTLTKLLLGYYQIDDDQILLDDKSIETNSLAKLISYVPQDTSLFHRSIADNIAYASDHEFGREAIVEAAKQAHADEFISQIDDGYEALVGERGVKLSAGQRQRIAIARAFLDDKPILILDEATSALDSESEILIQEALEKLWEHKTVIAIAHRLSTLRNMDRIVVMDAGKIVEQGSHQELLNKKGVYSQLWHHQSGGFLEE